MNQIYTQPAISSLHERPSLYNHKPDSFTGVIIHSSEKQYPSYSDRQFDGNGWRDPEPRSPMSESKKGLYEVSASKVGDMYQTRQDVTQKPPREQLPPLSSLFGSTPNQNRPAQSPFSDRHSPVFSAGSPNDSRHLATPLHPDRSYDYFQRPPVSQQYSYSSRPEQVDRHNIAPPPRPTHSGDRPESPRHEPRYGLVEAPRTQASHSVNGWSPHSQSSRSEYFARDTSSSFRPHLDTCPQPPPLHRQEPERQVYRGTHSAPVTPSYPPTPASIITGDAPATKDGLGPKIWTGTQFLPRFVRQAEVPGEGLCYFYDDGTHCKTVIEGEVVNAHWGVTKAGKPRKRLAIACITCREKKIKCDPDYPRCVQCEKFGRICKFKNAPRGGQGSPDTPPADPEDIVPRPVSSRTDTESFKAEKHEGSHSVSPRQAMRPGTPDSEVHHAKRHRTGYSEFTPVASEASPRPSLHEVASPATTWAEPTIAVPVDSSLLREWQTNPYTTRPALITELITIFFKHVPETAYCMLPEGPFKAWVLSSSEKSLDDLMLIYTILALGTIFSQKTELKAIGGQFAAISRYACDSRRFSIQLVQSRLLLALYYFATNNPNDSWDFCGGALRAASGLKLNLEMEKTDERFLKTFPYGLNRFGYAECRRRTFWSCYIMDRFNGFCSGHLSIIHTDDVFVRLPCEVKYFDSQADLQTPYFDLRAPPSPNSNWTIGSMAYLINISSIWGDVMANIYRTSQRPVPATSNTAFASFYDAVNQRLRAWVDSLPPSLTFSAENLKMATDSGKLGTFMTMHATYHTTVMKLNRHIQHATLSATQRAHHVSAVKQHADALLSIVDTLASRRHASPSSPSDRTAYPQIFSSPFVGYAIVSAIDALTAKFTINSVPALVNSFNGAESILAELATFWQSAKNQNLLVLQRIRDLEGLVKEGCSVPRYEAAVNAIGREIEGRFEMREAMEKTFARDFDCLYA